LHLLDNAYNVRCMSKAKIIIGDVRTAMKLIPDQSVQTCVTSPPYWGLRDYGEGDQIGLEETPEQYVDQMVQVFREVRRVLKDDGTLWLNIGDSYAGNMSRASNNGRAGFGSEREGVFSRMPDGLKPKDLVGIPWRLAFALQADGWYLRQDIIWAKPNPMPESVTDRCTKSHEYVFLLTKSRQYFYDHEAIKETALTEPKARDKNAEGYQADYAKGERFSAGERVFGADGMRNKRDVWTVATKPFKGAHFAVMPEALVEPCILAGSAAGDTVLDPFTGSGTVGMVALRHNRNFVGTELNPEYAELAVNRIYNDAPLLNEIEKELANG
jgi:DNA modification methylase